jgi:hypothetical protein
MWPRRRRETPQLDIHSTKYYIVLGMVPLASAQADTVGDGDGESER